MRLNPVSQPQRPTLNDAEPPAAGRTVPSLWELASTFGLISLTGFGGGQKAQIRRQVVSNKHWITDQDFIEALEVAELLPGPNLLNLAVFIGQRIRGIPGAFASLLAGSLPPFLIVLAAGAFYFSKFNTPLVHAALNGATAAAVGLTLANAVELTVDSGKQRLYNIVFVAATAVAVTYFRLSLVLTLLLFGGLSMLVYAMSKRKAATPTP
jgi:chromate transporter